MTSAWPTLAPRIAILVAVLVVSGCGDVVSFGPSKTKPLPDLLACPAGFQLWDYSRSEDRRPGSLFGPGGRMTGRLKVIERWIPFKDIIMVPKEEYDRVRVGMTYDEVRTAIPGEVLLPFTFAPDCEYDLCCVQGTRIALFRFRGGVLIDKDQQGLK